MIADARRCHHKSTLVAHNHDGCTSVGMLTIWSTNLGLPDQEAERSIYKSSTEDEALSHALVASELYMKGLQLAKDPKTRTRLRAKCLELLTIAERIKIGEDLSQLKNPDVEDVHRHDKPPASTRKLSTREEIILLAGSKLHGSLFPQWKTDSSRAVYQKGELYEDDYEITLSEAQQALCTGWERPKEALRPSQINVYSPTASFELSMTPKHAIDLVQDVLADCSLVASLCAIVARAQRGFSDSLFGGMQPCDRHSSQPLLSPNGRYMFRFYFNGCFREVVVDDRLPVSVHPHVLFVTDHANPGLLWPALMEKAYLKVRGGYNFPGSNSGTDLWIMIGWIPELVHLQSNEIAIDRLWERVHRSHHRGDLMMTLGTGEGVPNEGEVPELLSQHDYSVLAVEELHGKRMLLIKDPQRSETNSNPGDRRSHYTTSARAHARAERPLDHSDHDLACSESSWKSFEDVVQQFRSMYMSWNPALFTYRQDHHFYYTIDSKIPPNSLFHCPQYTIHSKSGGIVWLVLSRHFLTEESGKPRPSSVRGAEGEASLGYLSLYCFANSGERVCLSDNPLHSTPFVDSPQTLLRLEMPIDSIYTAVVTHQRLPPHKYSFSLSVFSRENLLIEQAKSKYPHATSLRGIWTSRSTGGNLDSDSIGCSPQYALDVPVASAINIILEADDHELPVAIRVVWAKGQRVANLTSKNVVVASEEYRRGCVVACHTSVAAGAYTIVCCPFVVGQAGTFSLHVESTAACSVQLLPMDHAGRYQICLPKAIITPGNCRASIPLSIPCITRMRVDAASSGIVRSPICLSIEQVRSSGACVLATSSDELDSSDSRYGMSSIEVDLNPYYQAPCSTFLVLETAHLPEYAVDITVNVVSDALIQFGSWTVCEA